MRTALGILAVIGLAMTSPAQATDFRKVSDVTSPALREFYDQFRDLCVAYEADYTRYRDFQCLRQGFEILNRDPRETWKSTVREALRNRYYPLYWAGVKYVSSSRPALRRLFNQMMDRMPYSRKDRLFRKRVKTTRHTLLESAARYPTLRTYELGHQDYASVGTGMILIDTATSEMLEFYVQEEENP